MTIDRLDREQALRYMSYRGGELSDRAKAYLDECEERVLRAIKPVFSYRVLRIVSSDPLTLEGALVLEGRDIAKHLSGCDSAAVFTVTVGSGVDRLIRSLQIEDMAKAVMADSFASTAAELAADEAEKEIKAKLPGRYFTWRFSPGYGDLPLSSQKELLRVTDALRRTGVHLLSDDLLTPLKSVTAIVGISDVPIEKSRRGCSECNIAESCSLRRSGQHCGVKGDI